MIDVAGLNGNNPCTTNRNTMQPRYGAHLGAQGRLLRGFADKCEDSLFEEPLVGRYPRVHTLASKCNSRTMDSSPLVTHTRQIFARGEEVCAPFEVSLAPLASGLMSAPRSSADGAGRRAARPSGAPVEVRRARFPVEIIPNLLSLEHREQSPSPKPQKYVGAPHSSAPQPHV